MRNSPTAQGYRNNKMKPSEVQVLLQANEAELIRIGKVVRRERENAGEVYKKIMHILRNTQFRSSDDHRYAYTEVQEFMARLFKPFRQE